MNAPAQYLAGSGWICRGGSGWISCELVEQSSELLIMAPRALTCYLPCVHREVVFER